MLRRSGPHQLRRRAVPDSPRWLESHAGGDGAVRPPSLFAFSQDASALAEAVHGIRAGRCRRPALGGLAACPLHAGKTQGLAGRPWPGGQLCGDFYHAHAFFEAMVSKIVIAPGVFLWREKFSTAQQKQLLDDVLARLEQAPLYRPVMPGNAKPFSVEESNFGPLGWVSDKTGYRYQATHPVTAKPWPAIPSVLLELWD